MLHLIAAGLVGVLVWAVFVLFSPYRPCRWCRNRRPSERRSCWRCKGRRDVRRFGAWPVHKIRLAIAQAWAEREWWR